MEDKNKKMTKKKSKKALIIIISIILIVICFLLLFKGDVWVWNEGEDTHCKSYQILLLSRTGRTKTNGNACHDNYTCHGNYKKKNNKYTINFKEDYQPCKKLTCTIKDNKLHCDNDRTYEKQNLLYYIWWLTT